MQEEVMEESAEEWQVRHDDQGSQYFFNINTGESTWQLDTNCASASVGSEGINPPSSASALAMPEWTQHVDELGNEYYVNTHTLETRWDRPEGFGDPPIQAAAFGSKRPSTAEEMANLNLLLGGNEDPGIQRDDSVVQLNADASGWIMLINEADGMPYYFNHLTGECVWELPEPYASTDQQLVQAASSSGTSIAGVPRAITPLVEQKSVRLTPELGERIKKALESTPRISARAAPSSAANNAWRPEIQSARQQHQQQQTTVPGVILADQTSTTPMESARFKHQEGEVKPLPELQSTPATPPPPATPMVPETLIPAKVEPEPSKESESMPPSNMELPSSESIPALPTKETAIVEPSLVSESPPGSASSSCMLRDKEPAPTPALESLTQEPRASDPPKPEPETAPPVVTVPSEPPVGQSATPSSSIDRNDGSTTAAVMDLTNPSTLPMESPTVVDQPMQPASHLPQSEPPQPATDASATSPMAPEPVKSPETTPLNEEVPESIALAADDSALQHIHQTELAALTIQCCVRCFVSRRRVRSRRIKQKRWYQGHDVDSHQLFYYNTENKFIQWQKPEGFIRGTALTEEMHQEITQQLQQLQEARRQRSSKSRASSPPRQSIISSSTTAAPAAKSSASPKASSPKSAKSRTEVTPPPVTNTPPDRPTLDTNKPRTAGGIRRKPIAQVEKQLESMTKRTRDIKTVRSQESMAKIKHQNAKTLEEWKANVAKWKQIYQQSRQAFLQEQAQANARVLEAIDLARTGSHAVTTFASAKSNPPSAGTPLPTTRKSHHTAATHWDCVQDTRSHHDLEEFRMRLARLMAPETFVTEAMDQRHIALDLRVHRLRKEENLLQSHIQSAQNQLTALSSGSNQALALTAQLEQLHQLQHQVGQCRSYWESILHNPNASFWGRFRGKMEQMPAGNAQVFVLNERNDQGDSLLHAACWNGKLGHVKHLVSLGVNVNGLDNTVSRMTPLHEACRAGHVTTVVFLIQAGARLDAVDGSGESCLHYACRYKWLSILQILLQTAKQAATQQQSSRDSGTGRSKCGAGTWRSTSEEDLPPSQQPQDPTRAGTSRRHQPHLAVGSAMNLQCSFYEFFHLRNYKKKRAMDLIVNPCQLLDLLQEYEQLLEKDPSKPHAKNRKKRLTSVS